MQQPAASPPVRLGLQQTVLALHILITLALVPLYFSGIQNGEAFYVETLLLPLSWIAVALFLWILISWYLTVRNLFDSYAIFIMAVLLFNAGHAVLEVFGWNTEGFLGGRFMPSGSVSALLLVIMGMAVFHLGALINVALGQAQPRTKLRRIPEPTPQDIRTVAWVVLLVSAPFTLLMLRNAVSVVVSGGYFSLYEQTASYGVEGSSQILADFLLPGALFLLAGSEKPSTRNLAVLVIVGYALVQIFLGSRNQATMSLLSLALLWDRLVWRIPKWPMLVAALFFLLVFFPLIARTRNLDVEDRGEGMLTSLERSENIAAESIGEMGSSLQTVAYTIELMPHTRDFENGRTYLLALTTVIPNFFWAAHPAIENRPTIWLIWNVNPYTAARGGSYGYSFIAEAYLNFGWAGAPLALGVIGWLLSRFVLWADRQPRSPLRLATVAAYTTFFLLYARGETNMVVRSFVWYALGPLIAVYLLAAFNRRFNKTSQRLIKPANPVG